MVTRLTLVVDLAIDLNVSSCLASSWEYVVLIVCCVHIQDQAEVEWDPDKNVGGYCSAVANIFEEKFWFCKVEAPRVDEFQIQVWKHLFLAYFEEAVDDNDKFWDTDRNISLILYTLETDFSADFLTEFLVEVHHLKFFCLPRN